MQDFLRALQEKKRSGAIPVIPDLKCYSPKDGELMNGRDPVHLARTLEKVGAAALSVVTEEKEFRGSVEMLRKVCEAVKIPVLRKDFIETEEDLDETSAAGASAVLLMYSCLGEEKLTRLYHAARARNLMPFVETHTEQELAMAEALGAPLVGINNRDILKLERDDGDVSHAAGLLEKAPQAFLVVESGLKDGRDVRRAVKAGADAALIGTAILKGEDPAVTFHSLSRRAGLKICGVMNPQDALLCAAYHTDITGFVVDYPVPVPWNILPGTAEELIGSVRGKTQTCVVTGGPTERVLQLARKLRPDWIQLHYKETLEETIRTAKALQEEGIRVIRSIPKDPAVCREMFGTAEFLRIAKELVGSTVDALLFDSRDGENAAAGGGSIFAIAAEAGSAAAWAEGKEIFIGGGITSENVRNAMDLFSPDLVDVMTGVEDAPGRKSPEKIRILTAAMAAVGA